MYFHASIRIYQRSTSVLQQRIELHTPSFPSRLASPGYRTSRVALNLFNVSRTSRERDGGCTASTDAVRRADAHGVTNSLQLGTHLGQRYGVHCSHHPLCKERVSTV